MLTIRVHREGDRYTLLLIGELDMASAHELVGRAQELCAQGARELVVDLTQLEFIDSAGLNAILGVRTLCKEHMCELRLTPGRRPVQRLFEITRVIDKLPFGNSRWARGRDASPQSPAHAQTPSSGRGV